MIDGVRGTTWSADEILMSGERRKMRLLGNISADRWRLPRSGLSVIGMLLV